MHRESINNEDILNLSDTYGDSSIGSPPEYDYLKIILTDDQVEIMLTRTRLFF